MIDDVAIDNMQAWPVWGHEHAVAELRAAAIRGPHHAYILSGFEHLGKSTIAKLFAMALLCTQPTSPGVPCFECRSCKRIDRKDGEQPIHPDVGVFDLERQSKMAEKSSASRNLTLNIQTVREITSSLAMRPLESRYRVVIVDDVESMQETAQEAFLKTLEEPPSYAVILLLTTDAELMLETIRSRANTIHLQNVPTERIQAGLLTQGVDADQAGRIAELSDGLPGWAIRAASDPKMLEERVALQTEAERWIDAERYYQLAEATRLGDAFGKDRASVINRLLAAQRQLRLRLISNIDASEPDLAKSVRALKSIDTCFRDLDSNVRPKLALQTMVLQWEISNK